jgi:hypothetical protein
METETEMSKHTGELKAEGEIPLEVTLTKAKRTRTVKEIYKLIESERTLKVSIRDVRLVRFLNSRGMTYNFGYEALQEFHGSMLRDLESVYEEAKSLDLFEMDHEEFKEGDAFFKWLSKQGKAIEKKLESQVAAGQVSFAGIKTFIKPGILMAFKNAEGHLQAMRVLKVDDLFSPFTGPYKAVRGQVLAHNGLTFILGQKSFDIPAFGGTMALSEMEIHPLREDEFKTLKERGARFRNLMSKPSYVACHGLLTRKNWWGAQLYNSNGRAMIDIRGMKNADPEYNHFEGVSRWNDDAEEVDETKISDEMLVTAIPYVYGFSFRAKKWGEMTLEDIQDIAYREDAFDKLVLGEQTKDLLLSLVDCSQLASGKDFVDGKGGGLVFLLHGTPGVGKTFTAEAISERLKRPLYMVSVGELGTNAVDVERQLTDVLETAQKWNAVLLLDECDIFLEKRTEDDMERNAVVSVFLRCVEYYQGILFLTTNRVKDLDPAFFSRISLPIHYQELASDGRQTIWFNHLLGHGVGEELANELARMMRSHSLNGRQIKNCIRLAVATAHKEGREVGYDDLIRVVNYLNDFIEVATAAGA